MNNTSALNVHPPRLHLGCLSFKKQSPSNAIAQNLPSNIISNSGFADLQSSMNQRNWKFIQEQDRILQTLLDQTEGKDLNLIEQALPYFEEMLASANNVKNVLKQHDELLLKMKDLNIQSRDVQKQHVLQSRSCRSKELDVNLQAIRCSATLCEMASFYGQSLDLRNDGNVELFSWLEKETAKTMPLPQLGLKEDVKKNLDMHREKSYQLHDMYFDRLTKETANILDGKPIDHEAKERADFIRKSQGEVVKLYLDSASQVLELDELLLRNCLGQYANAMYLAYLVRFAQLDLVQNKLVNLTKQADHQIELLVDFHKMRLKEEGQKLEQIIAIGQFRLKENGLAHNRYQAEMELKSKKSKDLFDFSVEKNRLEKQFTEMQNLHEQEMEIIRARLR